MTSDSIPMRAINAASTPVSGATWKAVIAKYQRPSAFRALWQIVNTLVPYALLWVAMYFTLQVSWWLVLPLAVLAGGFLVRIFIIFHDCGHGSFFKSRRANDIVGYIAGVLTFTPYYHWRWEHAIHHGSTGNLGKRGVGDIWTMTVQEYLASSRWNKVAYRLTRHPFFLLAVGPLFMFVVMQRFSARAANPRERYSVWWMNFAIFCMAAALSWVFGIGAYLFIQLIVMAVAGAAGVWMFYVQHQFEDAYWEREDDWDYTKAALQGSSFYKLPRVLQWFSGNIGFHHIHHLSSRIPNYNLQRCHEADPMFLRVKPITLFSSFKTGALRLWDEKSKKMVGFAHLRKMSHKQSR